MTWPLVLKFVHILAVAITIGGMFARQVVRGLARKSNDLTALAWLVRAVMRIDRLLVIPWSSIMILAGVALALVMKWPIFGFLQGAPQNWLLASNLLLVGIQGVIFGVFVPYNKKLEGILQTALAEGEITPELSAALAERKNQTWHHVEEVCILLIAALMVLKPF